MAGAHRLDNLTHPHNPGDDHHCRLHRQVNVIAPQAEDVYPVTEAIKPLLDRQVPVMAITIREEDLLPAVPPSMTWYSPPERRTRGFLAMPEA